MSEQDQNTEQVVEKKRQGRSLCKTTSKVFTPSVKKIGESGYEILVPYNDSTGQRKKAVVVLAVVGEKLIVTH